jgi:hypothetical protein
MMVDEDARVTVKYGDDAAEPTRQTLGATNHQQLRQNILNVSTYIEREKGCQI